MIADHVRIDHDGAVLVMSLDRPDKRNALSAAMYGALADWLAEADRDPEIRVVLIRAKVERSEQATTCPISLLLSRAKSIPTSSNF